MSSFVHSDSCSPIRIIADDFGLHQDINRGILECAHVGTITGCSVALTGIASTPEWISKLARIQKENKYFSVGVHLMLPENLELFTDFKKCSGFAMVISLTKSIIHMLVLMTQSSKIARAWEEQILKLIDAGIVPQHIDSHQHTHLFPFLWSKAYSLSKKYKIPIIRTGYQSVVQPLLLLSPVLFIFQILAFIRYCFLPTRRKTLGMFCSTRFRVDEIIPLLMRCMKANRPCEIVVHPGIETQSLKDAFPQWNSQWDRECEELVVLKKMIAAINDNQKIHREVLHSYVNASKATQNFISLRARLCPFWFIEPFLPTTGVILDFGAGHGYASVYMELREKNRTLLALDSSAQKRKIAKGAFSDAHAKGLAISCLEDTDLEMLNNLSGAMMLDVAYRIPFYQQEEIMTALCHTLQSGGIFVLKETVKAFSIRYMLAYLEECLVVSFQDRKLCMSFNFRTRDEWVRVLEKSGFTHVRVYAVPGETINNKSFVFVGQRE